MASIDWSIDKKAINHKDTKDTKKSKGLPISFFVLFCAYEECHCHEFNLQGIPIERQKPLPITYKGVKLNCDYKLNLLVDKLVVVEAIAVEEIAPIHEAQLLTYLKLSDLWLGLLINFNVEVVKDGIRRIVN